MDRATLRARLTGDRGQRLVPLTWWAEADRALADPTAHVVVILATRQTGKSTYAMAVGAERLLCRPNSSTLMVSAGREQIESLYERKLRRPIMRLAASTGLRIADTQRGLIYGGSTLELVAPTEDTGVSRAPDLLVVDEARYVSDEVFVALAPSIIGSGGKILAISTAGRPSGWFHELATGTEPEVRVIRVSENTNPGASAGIIDFLGRVLRRILPAAAARDLDNVFTDDGDEFLSANLIAAAVDDRLGEVAHSTSPAFCFYDLSRKRDLTSRVVVTRESARRPETPDHLVCASIRTWDPKASPTGEVDFAEVRQDMADLPRRFPGLQKILVDEGAEAGSVLPFARSHPRLSTLIGGFTATAESNMQMWSSLAARLHAGTLSIPQHGRMLGELRSLRAESFALGSKWRVTDGNRRLHRDVSLALAGAVHAAGVTEQCSWCSDPQCGGLHITSLGGALPTKRAPAVLDPIYSCVTSGVKVDDDAPADPVEPAWLGIEGDRAVLIVRDAESGAIGVVRHAGAGAAESTRRWRTEFAVIEHAVLGPPDEALLDRVIAEPCAITPHRLRLCLFPGLDWPLYRRVLALAIAAAEEDT